MTDKSRDKSNGNSRVSETEKCITDEGLGYCCEWFFWTRFERVESSVVADRLGVTKRTVNRHRAVHREGDYQCMYRENCTKHKLL